MDEHYHRRRNVGLGWWNVNGLVRWLLASAGTVRLRYIRLASELEKKTEVTTGADRRREAKERAIADKKRRSVPMQTMQPGLTALVPRRLKLRKHRLAAGSAN